MIRVKVYNRNWITIELVHIRKQTSIESMHQ
jgi:hypothetical protein